MPQHNKNPKQCNDKGRLWLFLSMSISLFKTINLSGFVGFNAPDRIQRKDLMLNSSDFLGCSFCAQCAFISGSQYCLMSGRL